MFWYLDKRPATKMLNEATHNAQLQAIADVRGLSYYADHALCRRLAMEQSVLVRYRQQLIDLALIAYRKPLYQVLAIEADTPRQAGPLQNLEQIFKRIGEGRS